MCKILPVCKAPIAQIGSDMKTRLDKACIRGKKVHIDWTLEPRIAKYLADKGLVFPNNRVRLATGYDANSKNLKIANENALEIIENLLLNKKIELEYSVGTYGRKIIEAGNTARSIRTAKDFMSVFENYILKEFGDKHVCQILPSDILFWQASLLKKGLSAGRVKRLRIVLNQILTAALNDGLINKNPIKAVKAPKVEQADIEVYTKQEVLHILSEASGWFKCFLTLAFSTGMRTGEMMALEWGDINFKSKKIIVNKSISHGILGLTKTGVTRRVDMLPSVESELRKQFALTGLKKGNVFLNRYGDGYRESGTIVNSHWKPLLQRAGLHTIDLYNTRHTFASIALSDGDNILWVSKMLGHKDYSVTAEYYAKFLEENYTPKSDFLSGVVSHSLVTNSSQDKKTSEKKVG